MTNITLPIHEIAYAFSWAILHAMWQGVLIYCLLRIILYFIPDNHSRYRYIISVSSLFLMSGWFITTFIQKLSLGHSISLNTQAIGSSDAVATQLVVDTTTLPYLERLSIWLDMNSSLITLFYLIGLCLFSARTLFNLVAVKKLKSSGIAINNREWIGAFDKSIAALKIKDSVQLLFSSKIDVPVVMGYFKPVILIPVALINQLTIHEAESILLHELAHVKRKDYLVNMIQLCIETALFFSPFVWLTSALIRQEREKCCDDIVVGFTDSKIPYVKALTALEVYRQSPTQPALAAKNSKYYLLNRIKRIMEMRKKQVNYTQLITVLVIIAALLTTITFTKPATVNAQPQTDTTKIKKKQPVKKTTPTKVVTPKTTGKVSDNSSDEPKDDTKTALEKEIEEEALKTAKITLASVNTILEELNLEEIIEDAFEQVDWDKISDDVEQSFNNVDWDSISDEIGDSLKNADWQKIKKELQAAREQSKEDMAQAREDLAEARKELANAQRQIAEANRKLVAAHRQKAMEISRHHQQMARKNAEKAADSARQAIKEAKETKQTEKYLSMMEADGLINREKDYKIHKVGHNLYINGIKQSKEVFKKYEPYMRTTDFMSFSVK